MCTSAPSYLYLYLSIYLSFCILIGINSKQPIHISSIIYQSIYPSINLSINLSIYHGSLLHYSFLSLFSLCFNAYNLTWDAARQTSDRHGHRTDSRYSPQALHCYVILYKFIIVLHINLL